MEHSVIMPVFNAEPYLQKAVESILSQTYGDFEFIIIDDGSTDNSVEILRHYEKIDPRIRFIGQPHLGHVAALNRGLAAAWGAWVFRMDADDIAVPQRLALQVARINRDPSLVLLGGWCETIDAAGNFLKRYRLPNDHQKLVCNLEKGGLFITHPTAAFRKDVVIRLGGYRERFRQGAEDTDLWLRMVGRGRFGCCQHTLLKLRKHSENISYRNLLPSLINTAAARICHYRKKLGYGDLLQFNEVEWDNFMKWLKVELEDINFFENRAALVNLRHTWNSNASDNKVVRAIKVLKKALDQPHVTRVIWQHYVIKRDVFYQLALKSLPLF